MSIKKLLEDIINSGVTRNLKIEEAQIVRLTNLFGMIPMGFFVIYIVNGLLFDISFLWQVGLLNIIMNGLCVWCNHKQYYTYAKTILLSANSIILLFFVNVVDGNSSAVAFFFPVLSCYVVFYDILKELKTVLLNLAVTATCILLCLILPAHELGFVALPEFLTGTMTRMNFLMAFVAFSIYVYTIIKVKLQTETLLIQSIEIAGIMAEKAEQMIKQLTTQKEKAENLNATHALFIRQITNELKEPVTQLADATNKLTHQRREPIEDQLQILKDCSSKMVAVTSKMVEFNNPGLEGKGSNKETIQHKI